MLDRFLYCDVERVSPEAPVPVLRYSHAREMLGGVGNVARNVAALGGSARLVGLVGNDNAARTILEMCAASPLLEDHMVRSAGRPTICKSRYLASNQQIVRVDEERTDELGDAEAEAILAAVAGAMEGCNAVILSDYGKGVLFPRLIAFVMARAREKGVPVYVDPKHNDYSRYRGATCITPNRKELALASGMPVGSEAEVAEAARKVMRDAEAHAILATRSELGMMLVEREGDVISVPAQVQQVFDVSGAGDTVIATFALACATGHTPGQALRLANAAAGVVVGKVGTATLDVPELLQALAREELAAHGKPGKILSLEQAVRLRGLWRRQGLSVGFTNGCFDILHAGHVSLLAASRAACDRLIVALNSDESVRVLKGPTRPVNALQDRSIVMAALESVDAVVSFGEETPLNLLQALEPDLLVKGGDYTIEQVVGADLVQAAGGRVMLVDLVAGKSTTRIIGRITGDGSHDAAMEKA